MRNTLLSVMLLACFQPLSLAAQGEIVGSDPSAPGGMIELETLRVFEAGPVVNLGRSYIDFADAAVNTKAAFSVDGGLSAKFNFGPYGVFGLQADLLFGMLQSKYPLDNSNMSGAPCIFRQLGLTVPVHLVLQTMSRDAGAFAGFGAWYTYAFRYELRGGFNNVLADMTAGALNRNQWGLGFTVGVRFRHLTLGYTARFQMNDLLYGDGAPNKPRTRSRYFTLAYLF